MAEAPGLVNGVSLWALELEEVSARELAVISAAHWVLAIGAF